MSANINEHYNNTVDPSKLSAKQRKELFIEDNPYAYANVYDPDLYESKIEKYNDGEFEASAVTRINIWENFVPTFYQYEWHKHFTQTVDPNDHRSPYLPETEGIAIVHRRGGKTTGIEKCVALPRMLKEVGHYVHVFPSLTQGRAALWNGMGRVNRDMTQQAIPYLELIPKALWKKKNNHNMTLELINGSTYQIVGARGADGTADHLRGLNPVGVIADEYPEWDKDIIDEIFGPIIGQNGGFIFKIGTPKGENHAFHDFNVSTEAMKSGDPKVKSWLLGADQTYYNDGSPIISEEYIKKQLAKGADPEKIAQEYYCSFKASASGAFYRHQMASIDQENRVTKLLYNPNQAVDAYWDLGGSDDAVVTIVQPKGPEKYNFLDCIKMSGYGTGQVMDAVNRKWSIRQHYFPHDGSHKVDMVNAFEDRVEVLKREKGIKNITVIQRGTKIDGIEMVKEVLQYCYFDEESCGDLVNDLKNYTRKKNISTGEFTDAPVHNRHSHGADSVRTFATALKRGLVEIPTETGMSSFKKKKLGRKTKFTYRNM